MAVTDAAAAVVLHFLFQLAQQESQNLGVQGKGELQPKLRALSEYIFWGLSLQNRFMLINLAKFTAHNI